MKLLFATGRRSGSVKQSRFMRRQAHRWMRRLWRLLGEDAPTRIFHKGGW